MISAIQLCNLILCRIRNQDHAGCDSRSCLSSGDRVVRFKWGISRNIFGAKEKTIIRFKLSELTDSLEWPRVPWKCFNKNVSLFFL